VRVLLLLLAIGLHAQGPSLPAPGVTPPGVTNHEAPRYPDSAKQAGLERSVVLELVLDAAGSVTEYNPLHPAGYGFDEAAMAAIRKWRFTPARLGDKPIPCRFILEMNFKLLDRKKALRNQYERDTYNAALTALANPANAQNALDKIRSLSQSNFAPAQFSEGVWRITGNYLPGDPAAGLKLLLAAAEQNYAPAVAQAGIYYHEGRHVPVNKQKALLMLKSAAGQRNAIAQLYLGELETEPGDSAFYYRLCALQNMAACQSRLAEFYLKQPREEFPRAIAWLRLAVAQNYKPAQELLAKQEPKLTEEERTRANAMRSIADLK
jgi:TonB family protein